MCAICSTGNSEREEQQPTGNTANARSYSCLCLFSVAASSPLTVHDIAADLSTLIVKAPSLHG